MNSLRSTIPGESWTSFLTVVLGVWMMVWLFAAIHNQYLIRIQPEHFTVWHYKIPFTQNYTLLGIAYAFGASILPGIMLGICLYSAGRLFDRPKLTFKGILLSTIWIWIAVEICAISTGAIVWHTGKGIYPDWIYPDDSRGLLTTQTIQVTAYLTGAFFSLLIVFWTWHRRQNTEQGAAANP